MNSNCTEVKTMPGQHGRTAQRKYTHCEHCCQPMGKHAHFECALAAPPVLPPLTAREEKEGLKYKLAAAEAATLAELRAVRDANGGKPVLGSDEYAGEPVSDRSDQRLVRSAVSVRYRRNNVAVYG